MINGVFGLASCRTWVRSHLATAHGSMAVPSGLWSRLACSPSSGACVIRPREHRHPQGILEVLMCLWPLARNDESSLLIAHRPREPLLTTHGSMAMPKGYSKFYCVCGHPDPPKFGPGWPESGPLDPGGAWIFIGRADDLVPGLAGRGGGPLRPPSGCPGERAHL